jgi:hypothetical protein
MYTRAPLLIATLLLASACGPREISLACRPMAEPADLAARPSPYDSVLVTVGGRQAQVCYSRPSAKGRVVFGGMVPFDSLWRTGANEPTILHLPFDAEIAGLAVPAGHYSLYTVPSQSQWQLVINASTGQWGLTRDEPKAGGGVNRSSYTAEVAAKELGRLPVSADSIAYTEQFTMRAEAGTGDSAELLLEWETTRVRIPIRAKTPSAN